MFGLEDLLRSRWISRHFDALLLLLVYHHVVVHRQILSSSVATSFQGAMRMGHHAKVVTVEKEVDWSLRQRCSVLQGFCKHARRDFNPLLARLLGLKS